MAWKSSTFGAPWVTEVHRAKGQGHDYTRLNPWDFDAIILANVLGKDVVVGVVRCRNGLKSVLTDFCQAEERARQTPPYPKVRVMEYDPDRDGDHLADQIEKLAWGVVCEDEDGMGDVIAGFADLSLAIAWCDVQNQFTTFGAISWCFGVFHVVELVEASK